MNFLNRYELSESISTGAVETFPARDLTSDERVLIHVFESPASRPANVPTIEWVLEAFNKVAPAPKAIVVNAGRYSGTAFLYLVTKMPPPDALSQWIESYQRYGSETQGLRRTPRPENREPRAGQPTVERKKPGTSAFPAVGRDLDPVNSGPPRSRPGDVSEIQTGDTSPYRRTQGATFTGLFLAEFNKSSGVSKAPETSHPINPDLGDSTRDRFARAPDSVAGAPRERTGEFTKFFNGPFSGEPSPDTPKNLTPTPVPERTPGEFTRLFGPEKTSRQPPPEPMSGVQTDYRSLTELRSESPQGRVDQLIRPPVVTPSLAFGPASKTPAPADVPGQPVSSALVMPPPTPVRPDSAPPVPPSEAPPPLSPPTAAGYNPENATQLFSYSGRASEPTLPAGPSEYTRIISRPSTPLAESRVETPVQGSGARIPFPVPPIAMPPFPPPPMPAMAPLPSLPAMAVPPPKLPEAPPEAKPVSYWPLILVMTVLFFLAVLLVMYFVLKH